MSRAFRKFRNCFIARKQMHFSDATERHELLHKTTSQEKADTKLILHAHKILKEGSSKAAIHSPSGDTDILLL